MRTLFATTLRSNQGEMESRFGAGGLRRPTIGKTRVIISQITKMIKRNPKGLTKFEKSFRTVRRNGHKAAPQNTKRKGWSNRFIESRRPNKTPTKRKKQTTPAVPKLIYASPTDVKPTPSPRRNFCGAILYVSHEPGGKSRSASSLRMESCTRLRFDSPIFGNMLGIASGNVFRYVIPQRYGSSWGVSLRIWASTPAVRPCSSVCPERASAALVFFRKSLQPSPGQSHCRR